MKVLKCTTMMLFILLGASGCGSESGQSDSSSGEQVNVNGAVEKGPFIVGSTVTINMLSEQGDNTGFTIVTSTNDDIGNFRFSVEAEKLLQTTSTGYYRNEITGGLSTGVLTLRSIYKATSEPEQHAYVNILTHLTSNRVLQLIRNSGVSYEQAVQQTESEFLSTFDRVIAGSPDSNFSSFSIYESQASTGSAYLLAISSVIYQYAIDRSITNSTNPDAELALLINEIEEDFGTDGVIDNDGKIELLRNTHKEINPMEVMNNVLNWANGFDGYSVPNLNEYLDSDLDGVVNSEDLDDDNDGIEDSEDSSPYTADFNISGQNISTDENVSVTIDISSNNPFGEDISLNVIKEPINGTLVGSYPEIVYIPSENYSGVDEFSYVLSQINITSQEVIISISISPVNDEPMISGIPLTEIIASNNYIFTPSVINVESEELVFNVENIPAWLTFNTVTGELSGAPNNENTGLYENITISVTDESSTIYLAPFSINVLANPWDAVATMPVGNHAPAVAKQGSKIFSVGGYGESGAYSGLDVYDTNTDVWQAKSAMQISKRGHTAHIINNILYVVAGERQWKETDVLLAYDILSDLWSTKSPLNVTRSFHASCVHNEKIYAFGGYTSNGLDDSTTHTKTVASTEVYDPDLDSWTMLASMSGNRSAFSCTTLNDKIYVFDKTGYEVYQPNSDIWESRVTLSLPGGGSEKLDGKIYLFGGSYGNSYEYTDKVVAFDPEGISWIEKSPLPEVRSLFGSTVVDGKLYILGGRNSTSNGLNSVITYTPSIDN